MAALALIPTRGGDLPPGAIEALVLADGNGVLFGAGANQLAVQLVEALPGSQIWSVESDLVRAMDWEAALSPIGGFAGPVLLPDSAAGRDLAPRLSVAWGRMFLPHVVDVDDTTCFTLLVRGTDSARCEVSSPVVATVAPHPVGPLSVAEGAAALALRTEGAGTSSAHPDGFDRSVVDGFDRSVVDDLVDAATLAAQAHAAGHGAGGAAVSSLGVLAADPATMDLAESPKIVAGGDGVGTEASFGDLQRVADGLGASVGGTRVVADIGLIGHDRQIGTTGVVVDPELYLAFGISGAVQHTSGLGSPAHIISVNTDSHCPMMAMADLAIVADAPSTLRELAGLLIGPSGDGDDVASGARSASTGGALHVVAGPGVE